jgi:NAD(P)-dependent dehydrogenase (short-subunit alcohol dehydrogenase family)
MGAVRPPQQRGQPRLRPHADVEAFYAAPGVKERREAMLPSRRIGTPADIADAVLFLASPRASYVNGAEILVDGGLGTALMELTPRPGF